MTSDHLNYPASTAPALRNKMDDAPTITRDMSDLEVRIRLLKQKVVNQAEINQTFITEEKRTLESLAVLKTRCLSVGLCSCKSVSKLK